MATALQQQLAAIAANSTHQLDLKAQKTRHSKSLLFEPREAATQSFDTIYQICIEGFDELCVLDSRFTPFARNLFAEQSKNEDRTELTARDNQELDRVVETFLGLLCGRLLLKPAMKAMEWLVRRFRVQEYNTEAVLMTFLPYHTSQIFPTLLSILPSKLPVNFRFLSPYVSSLQSPPRHAILSAVVASPSFISDFSHFTFRVSRSRHHSAILLGFWASITAQAVNSMIDSSRSGREAVRQQREEDLLIRILPLLQSAFDIDGVPELYLGCCMIVTIIVTKISVKDAVTDALMSTVAHAWTENTVEDGITCLAILADEKEDLSLPNAVMLALNQESNALTILNAVSQRIRTEKLLCSICLAAIDADMAGELLDPSIVLQSMIAQDLLSVQNMSLLVNSLAKKCALSSIGPKADTCAAILNHLVSNPKTKRLARKVLKRSDNGVSGVLAALGISNSPDDESERTNGEPIQTGEVARIEPAAELELSFPEISPPKSQHPSMLDAANDELFVNLAALFQQAANSNTDLERFLKLPVFSKHEWSTKITLLTFLTRLWVEHGSITVRSQAIEIALKQVNSSMKDSALDFQLLIPYALVAMSDPMLRVRKSAGKLLTAISRSPSAREGAEPTHTWADGVFYDAKSLDITYDGQRADLVKFLKDAILSSIEDCVLDGDRIIRLAADTLKGHDSRTSVEKNPEIKSSVRSAVAVFLARHAAKSPVLNVKVRLLEILSRSGKTANDARRNVLLPFVKNWSALTDSEVDAVCKRQHFDVGTINRAVATCFTHRSKEELSLLEKIIKDHSKNDSKFTEYALRRLSTIWKSLDGPEQNRIASLLLSLAFEPSTADNSETMQTEALDVFRNLPFTEDVLVYLVENSSDLNYQQAPEQLPKRRRTSKSEFIEQRPTDPLKLSQTIRGITVTLEVIEATDPAKHPRLLKGLFSLLSDLHVYKGLLGSQLIYLQSLLMHCLLSVVDGIKSNSLSNVDRSVIRADLIVECVRTTTSTQVHNAALLLISSLASWAPELVLHNVMPLFTFMSTTLLRQSDEYSAHVTDQTVERIVPPLAKSLRKKGKDLVTGASELLLSFTTAYEHIPLHRRPGLFHHLVQTFGPEDALFAVIAMLIDRYASDEQVLPFTMSLSNRFSVSVQLLAFQKYIDLVFDALQPKRNLSDIILGYSEKNAEQILDAVNHLLQSLAELLQSTALRKKLAQQLATNDDSSRAIQDSYASLLERIMRLSRQTSTNEDLKAAVDMVLASLLALTPTKDFIESSAKLMQSGSDETRQQVFRSLEARVAEAKRGDLELQRVYLDVLPNCCAFIRSDQPVATRHTAITCIDQIIEKYGKKQPTAVLEAAEFVAGPDALGSSDSSLRVISILCLASTVEVLGDDFITILPKALNKALDYLEAILAEQYIDQNIHSAVFGLVSAVLHHLPWLFSAQYLDRTLKAAAHSASRGSVADSAQFCAVVAQKVGATEAFAAIQRTWNEVLQRGPVAIKQHLELLQQSIKHHSKATITKNASLLFAILLQVFDLRSSLASSDMAVDSVNSDIFALVIQIALDMTLKLNDNTFRPFFIRLAEWAQSTTSEGTQSSRIFRKLSTYSFASTLFDQLKSIVTSYAGFLIDDAATLLQSLQTQSAVERELLDTVLDTLANSFRHDQDDFWQSPAHFDAVATPLVQQLERAATYSPTERVILTLTELAAAAASPEHQKSMNALIMALMRHRDAAVRLAAVQCERAITARLNFDWLALLPEMLPYISELQEDDDEQVERETLRWVKQIEEVTGESLDAMLQ